MDPTKDYFRTYESYGMINKSNWYFSGYFSAWKYPGIPGILGIYIIYVYRVIYTLLEYPFRMKMLRRILNRMIQAYDSYMIRKIQLEREYRF